MKVNIIGGVAVLPSKKKLSKREKQFIIFKVIHEMYGLTKEDLSARTRKRECVEKRQLTMHFITKICKKGQAVTGAIFDNRDHSTVHHANKVVSNLRETDRKYSKMYDSILSNINKEITCYKEVKNATCTEVFKELLTKVSCFVDTNYWTNRYITSI